MIFAVVAILLIPCFFITNCLGVVAEGAITVGGIAIAAEIIVSLGISIFVGASLKDAIEQISNAENMPIRQWVQNTMQDFAEFSDLTWENFMNVFTQGVGYTDAGILTFDRSAANWFADLVDYAINEAGLDAYLPAVSTPELETQVFTQGDYTVSSVVNPVTFFEVLEESLNMTWLDENKRTQFIQKIMQIEDYQHRVVATKMIKPELIGNVDMGTACWLYFTTKKIGDTITFNSNGQYTSNTMPYSISIRMASGVNGVEITGFNWSTQYNFYATLAANGTSVDDTFDYYNNLGGLVTGGQTDINAWDMPNDCIGGWTDIASTLFDYAGTVAGWDALNGSVVDINELINTYADVIIGAVNDVFGLDIIGMDEDIEITLDQDLVDELEDTAVPEWVETWDEIIEDDDTDTPITGTNDEETEDPTRPFQYTGDYTLDLSEFFPFCIPFDLYNLLKLFDGAPVAPVIEWPIEVDSLGIHEEIELDFSIFDSVAQVLRSLEVIAFGVGLCFITKNLIQGG